MASLLSQPDQQSPNNGSCLPSINVNCLGKSGQGAPKTNIPQLGVHQANEEMKATEDILASELSKLTVHERTKAMDDLHCVGEDLKETPEMIERSLEMFNKAVQNEKDTFYDMAASQNRAYLEDSSFRLRFIRANLHDVGKAVKQMLHFLRNKAKYFGTECIGRDVAIDDLNVQDQESLSKESVYHVQADKDQNGRVVVYAITGRIGLCSAESLCRIAYFVYFNVLGAIREVQMKGVVLVLYDTAKIDEKIAQPAFRLSAAFMDMVKCLPIRVSARHFCMKPKNEHLSLFDPLMKLVCKLSTEYSRARTKLCYGSDLEIQYQLRGHGINIKSCPIDSNGNVREDILNVWLYEYLRKEGSIGNIAVMKDSAAQDSTWLSLEDHALDFDDALHHSLDQDVEEMAEIGTSGLSFGNDEAASPALGGIKNNDESHSSDALPITPTEQDILLGRGKYIQNRPANIQLRHFVENHKEEYDRANRHGRRQVIAKMNKTLASNGVRFFKRMDNTVWVKCSSKEIETKIAQMFRDLRKQKP